MNNSNHSPFGKNITFFIQKLYRNLFIDFQWPNLRIQSHRPLIIPSLLEGLTPILIVAEYRATMHLYQAYLQVHSLDLQFRQWIAKIRCGCPPPLFTQCMGNFNKSWIWHTFVGNFVINYLELAIYGLYLLEKRTLIFTIFLLIEKIQS